MVSGLLSSFGRQVPGVVNCRVGVAVNLHDTMHRFRAGRGIGAVFLEYNIL